MARTDSSPPMPSTDRSAGRAHARTAALPPALRRLARAVWLPPALLTLAAGLLMIKRPVLWHDELATLTVIRRPTGAILAMLQHVDAVHGFYYLFMHYWTSLFGESPTMLRLPTVLAMSGAAACVALAGRRMFGARAGLLGGLVFALVPTVVRYGQEARSYAFVVLLASVALLALLRAVERPTVLRWGLYALSLVGTAYLHLVALTFLAAHGLAVLIAWWRERREWRRPVGFTAAVLLAVAFAYPLIHLGTKQSGRQISWITVPVPDDLTLVWGGIFCSTLMAGGVLLAGALAWGGPRRDSAALGTAGVLVPVLLLWELSRVGSVSYFIPKYMFFVLPAACVLAGGGLALVRLRGAAVALAVLGLLSLPDQAAVRDPLSHAHYEYPKPLTWFAPLDYRAAARIIDANYLPGDGAAYGQQRDAVWWGVDNGVPYYLQYLPHHVKLRDVGAGESGQQRDDLWPTLCAEPESCLHDEPRIWLVSKDDGDPDVLNTVTVPEQQTLDRHFTVQRVWKVSGLSVALLVRK
ncbi:glycosyltransferase family 39 protein [Kitasatospora cineracea]|uniref:Mannosyltransferase n=1 Tax=Kitasatospora cineracea TaxID=88074 RepID=A0A8G1UHF0_9ACTN|nr:glycosyltransferase family 39 protein [Kitasatospora cineracea]ROR44007.1 mannosyltransferase [Kitasatospora cineracea]